MTLRFHLPPGDVPPASAARHLGLALEAFKLALPALRARGFPDADETTGNFYLPAIEAWQRSRHPQFFPAPTLPAGPRARDAKTIDVRERLSHLRPRSAAK